MFGVPGVFGLLAGGLASGFVLAVFMANSGGAWDNAKKYIEQGHVGDKGSESHKAAVIGRSEEHTSELQSRDSISYAVFCLKKKRPAKESSAAMISL